MDLFKKKPEDAPTGVDLNEDLPQGRNPIPRLFYVAAVLLLVAFIAVMVGLVRRGHQRTEADRSKVTRELAAEPATSSRQVIEAQEPTRAGPLLASAYAVVPAAQPTNAVAPVPVVNAVPNAWTYQQPAMAPWGMPVASPEPTVGQVPPVEQAAQEAEVKAIHDEDAARSAPTTVKLDDSGPSRKQEPYVSDLPVPIDSPIVGSVRPVSAERVQPSEQEQKIAFQKEHPGSEQRDDYLHASRTDPQSRFELLEGTRIPATTDEQAISDIPGQITAIVRRDVMDSLTGKYVLVPAGSRLIGEYNSTVSYGQNRLQIVWTRVLFPDTTFLDLGRMDAHAADGSTGLHDKTDAHWWRTIGGVVLTSVLSAGFQLSQNRTGTASALTYPNSGQVVAGAIGQQAAQLGQELTQRNLNVQPSIKIRPGQQFFVFVKRDIVFEAPYEARL